MAIVAGIRTGVRPRSRIRYGGHYAPVRRVTQPGRLAIVYSQPSEAAEYRSYLEYLGVRGYVTGEVEDLAIEELQGVHGLRALRVGIDLSVPAPDVGEAVRQAREAPLRG